MPLLDLEYVEYICCLVLNIHTTDNNTVLYFALKLEI